MPSQPLQLAILWHQHQPYYKFGNRYLLPWTRLHATKDYYDIAAALEGFPKIRQTINVVPSLLMQLLDYGNNGATDRVLDLSRTPAAYLGTEEKIDILRNFFLCNEERMIRPYPRYRVLYQRGAVHRDDFDALRHAAASFTTQDWLDLQVWYNLTWIGEYSRNREPFASLLRKGQSFTEEEKRELLDASMEIVRNVIPTYRRLMEEERIELSVTAFYHPILPILCDSFSALEAMPNSDLPTRHIHYPEDAETHIRRAVEMFHEQFGVTPNGMWPSEGSVSDDAMNLIRGAGLLWAASDEEVLRNTLGQRWTPLAKYFPYTLKTKNGPLWTVFRDHELSDTIGFVYSNWTPREAALDFYNRLVEIRSKIIQERGAAALANAVVPVILDGENCWEYYQNNGRPFLEALYGLLSESNEIVTTTVWDALKDRAPNPERTIGRIYSGSWIGSNFRIWIGHSEDNAAWDQLSLARTALMDARDRLDEATFREAMEEIYIAEGSDWFWWYGDENSTANQDDFDRLFRAHLIRVYELLAVEPPEELMVPIRHAARKPRVVTPSGRITPIIDGKRGPEEEWAASGYFVIADVGGAMHRADAMERWIRYGCDDSTLYIRYDSPSPLQEGHQVRMILFGRRSVTIRFGVEQIGVEAETDERGIVTIAGLSAAVGEVIEAAIPLRHLDGTGVTPEEIGIVCELYESGHETERFPHQGDIRLPLRTS